MKSISNRFKNTPVAARIRFRTGRLKRFAAIASAAAMLPLMAPAASTGSAGSDASAGGPGGSYRATSSESTADAAATKVTNSPPERILPSSMDSLDDHYQLAIGDQVSFRIVEDEENPKTLLVMDSGDLEVPYLGRFPVAGKTCKELAGALKQELEKEYYYHATVIVAVDAKTKSRGKVYLVGAVHTPGAEEIPSDEVMTVSKAILRAGGFMDFADEKKVRVMRKKSGVSDDKETFIVDVSQILQQGKMGQDLKLEAGDVIYVSERLIRF